MVRAGLIVGGITLVLGLVGGFIFAPLCVPCLALFAGTGAGYLAGQFDRPGMSNTAVRLGAQAGAIAGIAALLAHLIAGVSNAALVGPEGAAEMMRQFGLEGDASNPAVYYASAFGTSCCMGLFEIALMAGTGALGGMLWFNTAGKNQSAPPAAPAAPAM
jgi:hypothetical protein